MHSKRYPILAVAALGFALSGATVAQEAVAPAVEPPAADAPVAAPATPAPIETAPEAAAPPSAQPVAPPAAQPVAPPQPEITVTEHGDWEVGCLNGTPQCELQQVAIDSTSNPVVLVRIVRLPEGSDAQALAVFNTPLGTLLPQGLSFRIDAAQTATLPFEWCVQEGCIVRLGLREPDVAAMKRGNVVNLTVTSIADPSTPVELTLSLAGFTAGYDSLPVPAPPPAPPAPVAAPTPAPAQE